MADFSKLFAAAGSAPAKPKKAEYPPKTANKNVVQASQFATEKENKALKAILESHGIDWKAELEQLLNSVRTPEITLKPSAILNRTAPIFPDPDNPEDEKLLFYDIEVFANDCLVVFKSIKNEEVAHFWSESRTPGKNGFEGIPRVIDGKTLVGYNNHSYDDRILYAMMTGCRPENIKRLNDDIISGKAVRVNKVKGTLDCMQEISSTPISLKAIEGNMGVSVVESSVPFDINRPLTEAEKAEVLAYCRYDVESTIRIYKLRKKDYFEIRESLLELLKNDRVRAFEWGTKTIGIKHLLGNKNLTFWDSLKIPAEYWQHVDGLPAPVWELWKAKEADLVGKIQRGESFKDDGTGYTCDLFGCEFTFSAGGLHAVTKENKVFRNVKLLDVASMYPSIIINLNALESATRKFKQMKNERVKIKHTDKQRATALKLILNSIYGKMREKPYDPENTGVCNPLGALTVCVYGQMALFDLCRDLDSAGYQIIQGNTDGVTFWTPIESPDPWEPIKKKWEKRWKLDLELDEFSAWYQKDVNNYIAVTPSGSVKVKGGYLNKYKLDPEHGVHNYFKNEDLRIVQMAICEYLLHGTPLRETVENDLNNPLDFQMILRAGHSAVDQNGKEYQKVNRIFAAKPDFSESVTLKKQSFTKRKGEAGKVLTVSKFPNAPENMVIWNDDLESLDLDWFKSVVDTEFYIQQAEAALKKTWKLPEDFKPLIDDGEPENENTDSESD